MKKIFTLIAMALMAISANAQTELKLGGQHPVTQSWSWGWDQPVGADVNLKFSQWGEYRLATEGLTEGSTYKLVVEEANDKVNIRINNTNNDDTQYIAITATEMTGTIPAGTKDIELQGTEDDTKIHIKSFEIDGQQTSYSTNWGVTVETTIYVSTSQWAELYLIGTEGVAGEKITLTANSPFPENLQLKVYKEEGEDYPAITPGETVFEYTADAAFKAISIQAKEKDIQMDIASATSTVPSGIADVKTAKAQTAVRYNLSGQQVDASYKGVVIENGKKFVVK